MTDIKETINKLFADIQFEKEPAGLYDPLRYMISIGGKRIRPTLCLLTYLLYRHDINEAILEPAVSIPALVFPLPLSPPPPSPGAEGTMSPSPPSIAARSYTPPSAAILSKKSPAVEQERAIAATAATARMLYNVFFISLVKLQYRCSPTGLRCRKAITYYRAALQSRSIDERTVPFG